MLDLDLIRIDGGTQSRVDLNQETVAEYAEAFKAGAQFPPVTVFFDGTHRWLADGFHRYFGAKAAGLTQIYETVTPGTQRDAIRFSLGANGAHGVRRTNADKRKAVLVALNDTEWSSLPHKEIAAMCNVSREYVSRLASEIELSCDRSQDAKRVVTRNGKAYKQDTAKIGKTKAPTVAEAIEPPQVKDDEAYDPSADALKEADSTISMLAEENDELRTRLAVGVMVGTDEEKREAADTIAALRQQVKSLEAEVSALRASRDHFQAEASELRIQIKRNDKELKRARAAA